MKEIKGDLHIHTKVSDCDYNIEEVIIRAAKKGITHMAITDHDTTLGNNKALKLGEKYGVKVSKGIEISAYDYKRNRKAHILGYNVNGKAVKKLCETILKTRNSTSKQMHKIICELGYKISWNDVLKHAGETGVFKQHIMLALIEKGYTNGIYSKLYRELFKRDGPANIPLEYIDVFDALKAIKDDGGLGVLAHPAQLRNEDLIPELAKAGLDGIEVYHPEHSEVEVENLLKIAKVNNLLVSGGSDFHGNMGNKKVELGECTSSIEMIEKIFKRI